MTLSFCRCGKIKGQCGCVHVTQTTTQRGYGSDWQRLSKRIRHENPLCFDCLDNGRVRPATQVHHVVPVSIDPALRLDLANLVQLCADCHESRHSNNAKGGKIGGRGDSEHMASK